VVHGVLKLVVALCEVLSEFVPEVLQMSDFGVIDDFLSFKEGIQFLLVFLLLSKLCPHRVYLAFELILNLHVFRFGLVEV